LPPLGFPIPFCCTDPFRPPSTVWPPWSHAVSFWFIPGDRAARGHGTGTTDHLGPYCPAGMGYVCHVPLGDHCPHPIVSHYVPKPLGHHCVYLPICPGPCPRAHNPEGPGPGRP